MTTKTNSVQRISTAPAVAVIVGGGTMGTGVAASFLSHGWTVDLVEPDPATRNSLHERLGALLSASADGAGMLNRLRSHATLASVDWTPVQFVSENVYEDLDTKRRVFAQLVELAPHGIPLTSNSTTLFAKDIATGLAQAERVMNAHFLMPAHLVPLVEVLATPEVSPEVVDRCWGVLLSIGKAPVRLTKALPGFLVNRIQSALMREALALVEAGVASAHDVDTAVRYGFGFRYAACGPLLQKEHSGWNISHKLFEAVFPTLANNTEPPALISRMVANGHTGMKAGHGFVRWTATSMADERKRFNRDMNAALEVVRGRPDDTVPDWVE